MGLLHLSAFAWVGVMVVKGGSGVGQPLTEQTTGLPEALIRKG